MTSRRLDASLSGYNALGKLHFDLCQLGPGSVSIDFGAVGWIDAHLASALRVLVDQAGLRGQVLQLHNMDRNVSTILRKNGFLVGTLRDTYSTTIPCTSFQSGQEVEFAEFVRRHLSHGSMPKMLVSLQRKFFEGIDEIFANCSLHSNTVTSIAVCGQFFPRLERLTFVITDGGQGVLGSYRNWSGRDIPACKAIDWAMQSQSTTRVGDIPGGLGLSLIREFVSLNGGRLSACSERGYWCQDGPNVSMSDMQFSFPGTSLMLEIDCTDNKRYDFTAAASPHNIW